MTLFFLSQVLGHPVCARGGERLGRIKDLVARIESVDTNEVRPENYPPISGMVVDMQKRNVFIPWTQTASLGPPGARLSTSRIDIRAFERREGEVLLRRDILDKQLVDIEGRRVILANDLLLYDGDGTVRVAAVDVSGEALVRRLTFGRFFASVDSPQPPERKGRRRQRQRRAGPIELITWADIEPLATSTRGARLRLRHERLNLLHPVDLARILDSLSYRHGTEIIESLNNEMAADTLQEMDEERQADIVEGMDRERAADILEEMAPDDAADLLGDMTEAQAQDLLRRMDRDDAEDVEELLRYPEHSAGGIMTSEFLSLPARLTVDDTIAFMRQLEDVPDLVDYLFVIEENIAGTDWAQIAQQGGGTLIGIVALRDLITASGDRTLRDLMSTDFVWVHAEDSRDHATQLMAEYNLMALPTLDDEGRILGIITVDDVMEVVLPERQLRRLPRMFG